MNQLQQESDCDSLVETDDRNLDAQFTLQLVHRLNSNQTIASEIEEVIIHADRFNSENFLPDAGDTALEMRGRSNERGL